MKSPKENKNKNILCEKLIYQIRRNIKPLKFRLKYEIFPMSEKFFLKVKRERCSEEMTNFEKNLEQEPKVCQN